MLLKLPVAYSNNSSKGSFDFSYLFLKNIDILKLSNSEVKVIGDSNNSLVKFDINFNFPLYFSGISGKGLRVRVRDNLTNYSDIWFKIKGTSLSNQDNTSYNFES